MLSIYDAHRPKLHRHDKTVTIHTFSKRRHFVFRKTVFLPSKRPFLAAQKTAFHNVLNHKALRNR